MIKVAFILPSLAQKGPIIVAKDCIDQLHKKIDIDVYYFDNIVEVEFNCPVYKISYSDDINFEKYDIIHSHMYRPNKYVWKKRKKITGQTLTTMHCDIRKDLRYSYNIAISFFYRWIWLFFIRGHDKVVVLTNYIMSTYYRYYIPENKLVCIYNGRPIPIVPQDDISNDLFFANIRRAGFKIIGANAFLTKRKGLHHIINVLPLIKDFVFVVIGDGNEMKYLKNLALHLSVHDRCFFLGYKKDAVSYLKYYDVYAMPSLSEGFSLALIEATMSKKSCICSNVEEIHEIFTPDEVTFCKPHDRNSLRSALIEAYSKRHEKGQRAYERSLKHYTSEIMGQCYLNLYKSMQRIKIST
jgi:glycosyltransferase involved in cell wall biosynthesis